MVFVVMSADMMNTVRLDKAAHEENSVIKLTRYRHVCHPRVFRLQTCMSQLSANSLDDGPATARTLLSIGLTRVFLVLFLW